MKLQSVWIEKMMAANWLGFGIIQNWGWACSSSTFSAVSLRPAFALLLIFPNFDSASPVRVASLPYHPSKFIAALI
ncbi:MAG TPA: hypothetical protein VGD60_17335 [Candidatus Acidoferrales bacterium]